MVFERVVMLGMSEGRFPPRRLEGLLLPDIARAAADGHLQLRTDRQLDDRRNLLAAIAGADRAVLSQPRGDLRRSTDQPASRWLLADAARLARVDRIESSALRDRAAEPWLDHIPSFAGGLAHSSAHPSSQELRLAAIARRSLTHPVLTDDRDVRAALEVVRARRSNAFTRFDGNLSGLGADLALPTRISTTGLEVWAKCPRTYLFRHVLKVEPREEPERLFEIDPRTRGTLVHTILEKFVHSAIKEEHPFGCWTPSDRDRLQQIAAAQFDEAEREGRSWSRHPVARRTHPHRSRTRPPTHHGFTASSRRDAATGRRVAVRRRRNRVTLRSRSPHARFRRPHRRRCGWLAGGH